jgi:hypothetical protein
LKNAPATYNVHENLLRGHSAYFDELLGAQIERKPLLLTGVNRQAFDAFSRWIYTRRLKPDDIDNDINNEDNKDEEHEVQQNHLVTVAASIRTLLKEIRTVTAKGFIHVKQRWS